MGILPLDKIEHDQQRRLNRMHSEEYGKVADHIVTQEHFYK